MKTLKRRRQENKTDYGKRVNVIKSGIPRVVFRKTNKYVIAEYTTSKAAQDKIELGTTSKVLLMHGWPKELSGSLKSTPAVYLTGFLFGKEILAKKLQIPIIDIGMTRNIHKNKVFAFLKGLKDSGLNVKCEEQYYPDENRIKGKHLKEDFSKTFEEIKLKIQKIK
ncbi:MAG: 50S ribosomal protein L18 [Nanoarchaeota archaeon]